MCLNPLTLTVSDPATDTHGLFPELAQQLPSFTWYATAKYDLENANAIENGNGTFTYSIDQTRLPDFSGVVKYLFDDFSGQLDENDPIPPEITTLLDNTNALFGGESFADMAGIGGSGDTGDGAADTIDGNVSSDDEGSVQIDYGFEDKNNISNILGFLSGTEPLDLISVTINKDYPIETTDIPLTGRELLATFYGVVSITGQLDLIPSLDFDINLTAGLDTDGFYIMDQPGSGPIFGITGSVELKGTFDGVIGNNVAGIPVIDVQLGGTLSATVGIGVVNPHPDPDPPNNPEDWKVRPSEIGFQPSGNLSFTLSTDAGVGLDLDLAPPLYTTPTESITFVLYSFTSPPDDGAQAFADLKNEITTKLNDLENHVAPGLQKGYDNANAFAQTIRDLSNPNTKIKGLEELGTLPIVTVEDASSVLAAGYHRLNNLAAEWWSSFASSVGDDVSSVRQKAENYVNQQWNNLRKGAGEFVKNPGSVISDIGQSIGSLALTGPLPSDNGDIPGAGDWLPEQPTTLYMFSYNFDSADGILSIANNPAVNSPALDVTIAVVDDEEQNQQLLAISGPSFSFPVPVAYYSSGLFPPIIQQVQFNDVVFLPLAGITGIDITGTSAADTVIILPSGEPAGPQTTESLTIPVTIQGNGGNDYLVGGDGGNYLASGDTAGQSATLIGGAGPDTLVAGSGNDSLIGGAGSNTLIGGAGNDFLGEVGPEQGVDRSGDMDSITGGTGDDTIVGSPGGNDTLTGGQGQNVIYGMGANNVIFSGPSILPAGTTAASEGDYVDAGSGNNTIYGSAGNDTLIGGSGSDTIISLTGDDTLVAGSGDEILFAGSGNVYLYGSTGNDSLYGGTGNDTLVGGSGNEFLYGGPGAQILEAGTGNDVLQGYIPQSPNWTLNNPKTGNDVFLGGDGNDTINGGPGGPAYAPDIQGLSYTLIDAGTGNAWIVGGPGPNYINGGTGNDTISAGPANDTIIAVGGNDIITGGGGNDLIQISGNDTVDGSSGNDVIYMNGGTAAIVLGSGINVVNIEGVDGPTTINATSGTDTINIGSLAPASGGILGDIAGMVTVTGDKATVVNVDDTGDPDAETGTLTASTLSGLDLGGTISYSGLAQLNISLGLGGNTFYIAGTAAGTATSLDSGSGNDTVNVGTTASQANGVVDPVAGPVTINGGGGFDVLNVNDTGSAIDKTGTLTKDTITGLGMGGGITYDSVQTVNVSLGSGNNTFNVQSTSVETNILGGWFKNVFNVGSLAPLLGGILDAIAGNLTIDGGLGQSVLNVDDDGSTAAKSGTLTASTLTGMAMLGGITYDNVYSLNISVGSGNDQFTVANTDRASTFIHTGAGNDTVYVQSIDGNTLIQGGAGSDTFIVGGPAPC